MHIETPEVNASEQATGYNAFLVRIYPSEQQYLTTEMCIDGTDDITADDALDEIMRRYSGAWRKLSEL